MSCEQIISSSIGEEKGMIVAFGPCGFANYVLKRKKERKGDTVPRAPSPPPLVVNNLKSNHHDIVLNHPLEIMCGEDSEIFYQETYEAMKLVKNFHTNHIFPRHIPDRNRGII